GGLDEVKDVGDHTQGQTPQTLHSGCDDVQSQARTEDLTRGGAGGRNQVKDKGNHGQDQTSRTLHSGNDDNQSQSRTGGGAGGMDQVKDGGDHTQGQTPRTLDSGNGDNRSQPRTEDLTRGGAGGRDQVKDEGEGPQLEEVARLKVLLEEEKRARACAEGRISELEGLVANTTPHVQSRTTYTVPPGPPVIPEEGDAGMHDPIVSPGGYSGDMHSRVVSWSDTAVEHSSFVGGGGIGGEEEEGSWYTLGRSLSSYRTGGRSLGAIVSPSSTRRGIVEIPRRHDQASQVGEGRDEISTALSGLTVGAGGGDLEAALVRLMELEDENKSLKKLVAQWTEEDEGEEETPQNWTGRVSYLYWDMV
ncbi:unnamed protein product, partial [Choristocarpus tenellus]